MTTPGPPPGTPGGPPAGVPASPKALAYLQASVDHRKDPGHRPQPALPDAQTSFEIMVAVAQALGLACDTSSGKLPEGVVDPTGLGGLDPALLSTANDRIKAASGKP